MRRTTLTTLALAALCALPAAAPAGEGGMEERIDQLVARWRDGDDAARTGVVAEARALGEDAVGALFRRVARPRPPAPPRLGIAAPAAEETLAAERARLVVLTVRFARVEGPKSAAITRTRVVGDEEAEALRGEMTFVAAPRLTVYEGQRADVTVISEKQYTRTYDANRAPVKGTVQTGLLLDVRPTIVGDAVKLQLRSELAKLAGMDAVKTDAGAIEVPRVEKHETAITLTLSKGKATVAMPGDGAPLVVEIEAKVLGPDFLEEVK